MNTTRNGDAGRETTENCRATQISSDQNHPRTITNEEAIRVENRAPLAVLI
jgi:hypothetical protein